MTTKATKACSLEGCGKTHYGRGWCEKHYHRWRVYGDPLIGDKRFGVGDTPEQRFWSKTALTANPDKCWEWQGIKTQNGYGIGRSQGGSALAHRIAWFYVKGESPIEFLLHSCDNRACVNPRHLRKGTAKDNMQDALSRSRLTYAKLTEQDVDLIKGRLNAGVSGKAIALEFGVTTSTVSNIKTGRTWQHLER